MSADRGQALVIAAILIGIGALAIVGLRMVQERVLAHAHDQNAGEAAVEAAAAAIADEYIVRLESVRARAFESPRPTADVLGMLADPAIRESARAAASEAAARNGGVFDGPIDVRCAGDSIEIELHHAGRLHRAALPADTCSPR
jgi:hypothetical protein